MSIVRARRGGILHRAAELNEEVGQDQVVARIYNTVGELVEEVRAPHAGPVVRIATFPVVSAGERVVQLGVPR
jgi:predicted deacylase